MKAPAQRATPYDREFFDWHADRSLRSAQAIVPLVIDLTSPESVVDFGCGVGTWLQAFVECGVDDYLGLDGDYVDMSQLRIPADRFRPMDLTCPIALGRRFDLAVCLEVAEHLPATVAPALVQALTEAAPVVLFSAALPGQVGTNHINGQWSWYWEELFARHGFVRLDPVRPQVWRNPDVAWWYQQNTYLYADRTTLGDQPKLASEHGLTQEHPMELVRASILRYNVTPPSLRKLIGMLPGTVWRAISRRMWYRPAKPLDKP
jgi:SAM-dependent methyltransferase